MPQLGRITSARFDFSQLSSKYPALLRGELPNIFNPKMATGSLMDLGVYCVYPALDWFGEPEKINVSARFLPTGADESCTAIFEYPDKLLTLTCSKTGQSHLGSEILGDRGTLVIESISKLTGIRLFTGNDSRLIWGDEEKPTLMSGESMDFYRFIKDPEGPQKEYERASKLSLSVSRTMEKIRRLSGIRFPDYS